MRPCAAEFVGTFWLVWADVAVLYLTDRVSSATFSSAHRQAEEIEIHRSRKKPLVLTATNARSGNVDVQTRLLLDEGRHEVAETKAEAERGCRLPVVASLAIGNHDHHDANGR